MKLQRETHTTTKTLVLTWILLAVFFGWFAFKGAMAWNAAGGFGGSWGNAMATEILYFWRFSWNRYTPVFLIICFAVWGVLLGSTFSSLGKFRYGAEHGTAQWGNVKELSTKWTQEGKKMRPDGTLEIDPNIILSQNMRLGISNTGKTRKNKNILVIGGSGTRKSTGLVMPNIMQCNSSFIVTDPSGELYTGCGRLLEERGYVVKCLNLVDMSKSHAMNPFAYISKPEHVATLATNFIENTRDKNKSGGGDPFWDDAMKLLLMALIAYIWEWVPPEHQNFDMLTELVRMGRLDSDDMGAKSDLDKLFELLEKKEPDCLAWKNYLLYMQAPPKTRSSVVITLAARLGVFNIPAVSELTRRDELELDKLGDRKQALFCVIPQAETTFNFLVGLVYTSTFAALYKRGEEMPDEREDHKNFLKVPVQLLMDEFANVAVPDSFEQILATCRKYDISINIFLQNMTQLKKMYEKDWESVAGNCDTLIYLGGNESFTWKYLSEALDKETIKIRTSGKSGNSFSENEQIQGRDLMTKGEIRGLPDDKCIVMVRGEYGVMDDKYNITKHPNYKLIAMGGAPTYQQNFVRLTAEEIEALKMEDALFDELSLPSADPANTRWRGGMTPWQRETLASALRKQAVQRGVIPG